MQNKKYQWILFDADETLFHFDDFQGLQRMFAKFNVEFTAEDYKAYKKTNTELWLQHQDGKITVQELHHQRFAAWVRELPFTPLELDAHFLDALIEICSVLDGVDDLLQMLKGKVKLGIITNGYTKLMHARLERFGYHDHFDALVISEQVGVAKPHPGIFEHALELMGNPPPEKVLMVGDNPVSDILGGHNAGMDTCWLNMHNQSLPKNITPHYQISSINELKQLLQKFVCNRNSN